MWVEERKKRRSDTRAKDVDLAATLSIFLRRKIVVSHGSRDHSTHGLILPDWNEYYVGMGQNEYTEHLIGECRAN